MKRMTKVVFISYSHDSEEHKAWVRKLADDLSALGDFEILLDQYMPKGYSFTRYMELGLANSDKVLVIGTPQYKQKAETGKGVAFEESIISAEMMNDMDTTKYYPILRAGTFETSFPPILQGRNGDDMTDDSQYNIVIKEIAEAIQNERPLPGALSSTTLERGERKDTVAMVYFSFYHVFETYNYTFSGKRGLQIRVTVTNSSKEHRYFQEPFFKMSRPFEGNADAFSILTVVDTNNYPVKLEYGQQFTASYRVDSKIAKVFMRLLSEDPSLSIKAVVNTTLGEVIESESFALERMKGDLEELSQI